VPEHSSGSHDVLRATVAYTALTIALTWPVTIHLTDHVPSDLGDPLLNAWILAWDASHLLRAIGGNVSALAGYWHANIFFPHPYALAYSEHLTGQAVQILPVYALTGNPLLCYNLLFLSTFVLSGVGMFLLCRELTANRTVAFVGGLAYAFAPYRFGALSHLQVLSSAWMPFVLYGLRRFFATRRPAPLAGAVASWIAQNLSCGYYLVFFSPIVVIYIVWELTVRRLWRSAATIRRLAMAVATVVLATAPFVVPYLRLRQLGFAARSLYETEHYSADVYSYLTAWSGLWIWGQLAETWPKPEGLLYPGATVLILAGIALVHAFRESRRIAIASADDALQDTALRLVTTRILIVCMTVLLTIVVGLLLGWSLRGPIKITSLIRPLVAAALIGVALLVISPTARRVARDWISSASGVFALLTIFAAAMSLGPDIHTRGKRLEDANVYLLFYRYVPGFDGLRVPARFGMIVALGLAVLAACGVAAARHRRSFIPVLAGVCIVLESLAIPLRIDSPGFTPSVYRFIAELPASAVLVELPIGDVSSEVRYVFYSTVHWHRLVNGYSGGEPLEYTLLADRLKDLVRDPDRAWQALASSGATHVVVHRAGYGKEADAVFQWLRAHGAREIASFDADRVFELSSRI
jgi:hypothetical protein